jgi:hypothetical protein
MERILGQRYGKNGPAARMTLCFYPTTLEFNHPLDYGKTQKENITTEIRRRQP